MLRVLYLVHDLADPAVRRRIMMLKLGGAAVTVAGFRRTEQPVRNLEGLRPLDLGRTWDGAFPQRVWAVAAAGLSIRETLKGVSRPDVIVARNLEMLAIGSRARSSFDGADVPVVYECLDIHRLLLREDGIGRLLRTVERRMTRDIRLLITSSPAFARDYFAARGQVFAPIALVENKHLERDPDPAEPDPFGPPGPPFRIGWFGALRCKRSMHLLADFSRRAQGRIEVLLRGRPVLSEIPNFHAMAERAPFMSFGGPYRNPEDLSSIYGSVHFSWAVDFFEDGLNSRWLLPNRLYEGCRFGAIPIVMKGTETARFVEDRGIGIILSEPSVEALAEVLAPIDLARANELRSAVLGRGRHSWACDENECRVLVDTLAGSRTPSAGMAMH